MIARTASNILRSASTTFTRTRLLTATATIAISFLALSQPFSTSSILRSNGNARDMTSYPKGRTEEEWKIKLSPEQYRILRKKGTEMAGSGEYDKHQPTTGVYNCAACDTPLYKAETKFASGCGWPAYWDSIPGAVKEVVDSSYGMTRTEIVCTGCGGHLGHRGERYGNPKDERACVNSISIKYSKE